MCKIAPAQADSAKWDGMEPSGAEPKIFQPSPLVSVMHHPFVSFESLRTNGAARERQGERDRSLSVAMHHSFVFPSRASGRTGPRALCCYASLVRVSFESLRTNGGMRLRTNGGMSLRTNGGMSLRTNGTACSLLSCTTRSCFLREPQDERDRVRASGRTGPGGSGSKWLTMSQKAKPGLACCPTPRNQPCHAAG